MIVEVVVSVAGKMTGNFEVLKSDGTTFFRMASERGKRGEERNVREESRRQEMVSKRTPLRNSTLALDCHVINVSRESLKSTSAEI